MAQVMQPHVIKGGSGSDSTPRLFDIYKVSSRLLSTNHVRIAFEPWNALQHFERWGVQRHYFAPGLQILKQESFMFLAEMLPSQR